MKSSGKKVTLADVAAKAGVSVTSASFVLSGRSQGGPSGSTQVQKAVREAAAELGYVPNRFARAMRTGRTNAIVLALGSTFDPWANELAATVNRRATQHGLSTVVLVDDEWYEFVDSVGPDAVLLSEVDAKESGLEKARKLAAHGVNVIAMSTLAGADDFDVIYTSPRKAIVEAYTDLRSRHDRVWLMATETIMSRHITWSRDRAFVEAALANGDERSAQSLRWVDAGLRAARQGAADWLNSPDRPTAVICQTGYLAIALQAAAEQLGIAVPEELEFVAIGDVPVTYQMFAPISYYGAEQVFDRIADVVVQRALHGRSEPFALHQLQWRLHRGATSR